MVIGMNTKYKEKLRMKRKLTLILIAIFLVAMLFVSCKVEMDNVGGKTVTLRFRTDDESRSLNSTRTSFDADNYVWYYTANKTDGTPASGTKTEETLVGDIGKLTETVKDSFSLGKWNFSLFGYDKKKTEDSYTLVFSGSVTDYEIEDNDNTIDIVVTPMKTENGKGTIIVSKDIALTANGESYKATGVIVKGVDMTYNNEEEETNFGEERNDLTFSDLASGSYKVIVKYRPATIAYASNEIYVNVWNGLTTTIGGTLDETTVYKKFNADDGTISGEKPITAGGESTETLTFDYSPSNMVAKDDNKKTTVKAMPLT